ncbi:MAG: glycoside hydrolase family 5 protein [Candidatus Omnitrophica bacterium]|nr:glycoside hydrolase family 5 protein [Candidatus Omnitrophota bacterium]
MLKKLPFLKTSGTKIVDEAGKPVTLRGVNLGSWLLMEGYILGGRHIPEKVFRADFEKALGAEAHKDFTRSFRDNFIREDDIVTIKEWGANCIRVPFNYRIIEFEDRPYSLNEEGLSCLDKVVRWCEKHQLYCIIDMHAAPGAQNPDWHSDCVGKPEFFDNEYNRDRYYRLWHFLATHYKDASNIAAYDVLNEPVIDIERENQLKELYEGVTREIRDVDQKHMILLEGNMFGKRLGFLGKPSDSNTAFSVHAYLPIDYVFGLEKDLIYPGRAHNIMWTKGRIELIARPYHMLQQKLGVPIFIGEFGVHWRGGHYGETRWVEDVVSIFEGFGWSWAYWTYKSVANGIQPDGIFRYTKNPPWVNRNGPATGMETFAACWPKYRSQMISSWRTKNFVLNEKLLAVLEKFF